MTSTQQPSRANEDNAIDLSAIVVEVSRKLPDDQEAFLRATVSLEYPNVATGRKEEIKSKVQELRNEKELPILLANVASDDKIDDFIAFLQRCLDIIQMGNILRDYLQSHDVTYKEKEPVKEKNVNDSGTRKPEPDSDTNVNTDKTSVSSNKGQEETNIMHKPASAPTSETDSQQSHGYTLDVDGSVEKFDGGTLDAIPKGARPKVNLNPDPTRDKIPRELSEPSSGTEDGSNTSTRSDVIPTRDP